MATWNKANPAAGIAANTLDNHIRTNQDALETAIDNEHDFATGGTQTGIHTQGSARCFFQDTAPATRINGDAFTSVDLGSLWFDTNSDPDNQLNVLTAITPTWTPVSTEIIAALLASGRVFASTLNVQGNFAVGPTGGEFKVAALSGNTTVAGYLDIAGVIDPTSFSKSRGGFLDEDNMASDAADKVASQQSIKKYVDDKVSDLLIVPAKVTNIFGAWTNKNSIDGTLVKTSVYKVGSDGFILIANNNQDNATMLTDGSNPPTTVRWSASTSYMNSGMIPVRKDDYWKVTSNLTPTIYWLPIGSGACVLQ